MGRSWAMNGPCKKQVSEHYHGFYLNTGAPGGSRTHDLWLRKPTLYPTELRAQVADYNKLA
jgi:hypothetical protein